MLPALTRGQLVGIPDQHQPAGELHRPQERVKKQVSTIDTSSRMITSHPRVFRSFWRNLLRCSRGVHLQQPVDRLGLLSGQLAHPLGGPAGGGREGHLLALPLEEGDDGV